MFFFLSEIVRSAYSMLTSAASSVERFRKDLIPKVIKRFAVSVGQTSYVTKAYKRRLSFSSYIILNTEMKKYKTVWVALPSST